MSGQWYFSHDGATHGPFSVAEIQDRVAQKRLLSTDAVWPEGRSPKDAAPAAVVFDFTAAAASAAVPDWLPDVAAAQSTEAAQAPLHSQESPEWLEDLRLWVGLDLYTPAVSTAGDAPAPNAAIPDWLDGWLTPEAAKTSPRPPTAAAPPAPAVPLARPVAPPVKPSPAPPASIPVASLAPPVRSVPTPDVARCVPVVAPVVSARRPSVQATPPAPATKAPSSAKTQTVAETRANPRVEAMRQASGFDPETGQILDAAKFRIWQQQQARPATSGQPAVNNASLLEAFRKARFAIEAWADDGVNRSCIMQTDIAEIKQRPAIQAILREYANYGQAMQEKLLRHVEFMVENRKKYYKAVAARSN